MRVRKQLTALGLCLLLSCPAAAVGGSSKVPAGAPATRSAKTAAAGNPPARQPATRRSVPGRSRPEFRVPTNAGTTGLLYRMLAYTLIILVLGGAALFVIKRVLPKIASSTGKSISVLETVYLGPRKTLHLLQVGSQRFLVAGSRDQVSMLGEVTSAFAGEDAPAEAGGEPTFASVLHNRTASGAEPDGS